MMKLRVEDLLDYVQAGERDPQIGQLLRNDPDGPEKLRQARVMFELLGSAPKSDGGATERQSSGVISMAAKRSATRPQEEAAPVPEVEEAVPPRFLYGSDTSETAHVSRLAREASLKLLGSRTLGTLQVSVRGRLLLLAYSEDEESLERLGVKHKKGDVDVSKGKGTSKAQTMLAGTFKREPLKIKGRELELLMDDQQSSAHGIRFRITTGYVKTPARALELIYMPEEGPFDKMVTDSRGVAELSLPQKSGVLRIGSDPISLLKIQLNK